MIDAMKSRLGDLIGAADWLGLLLADAPVAEIPPVLLARAMVDVDRFAAEMTAIQMRIEDALPRPDPDAER